MPGVVEGFSGRGEAEGRSVDLKKQISVISSSIDISTDGKDDAVPQKGNQVKGAGKDA